MPTGGTTDLARFLTDLEAYAELAEVDFDNREADCTGDAASRVFGYWNR